MKRRLLLLLILSAPLLGEEEILLTRQAEAYYEAREYDRARELFEKLEGEKLQPWQGARLLYNIGTTYLEEGNWEKTAEEYAAVADLPARAYYINRALKTNQAVMLYRQSLAITSRDDLNLGDYTKAFFLLRDALKSIKEAQEADCRLAAFMGMEKCDGGADLIELRSGVKKELAIVLRKYGEAKIAETPVKDGVPFLLAGVKVALSHLDFLMGKKLEESLRKNYLKLFTRDVESWLSLWEDQLEQLEDLEEAYDDFYEGIQKMKIEEFEDSRIAFLSSEASLSKLIQKLWGMDPLVKLLQKLMAGYERTLDQVPMQTSTLYQLETEQKQIEKISKPDESSEKYFSMSNGFLKRSLEYASQAKPTHARFFLHEARQWIRRLLRTKTPVENAPESLLEDAIEDQSHALMLHRLNESMADDRDSVKPFIKSSQEQTLETAAPFIAAVLEKEKEEYPERCQCKPWNKVIPLFEKGREAAEGSLALIQKEGRTPQAINLQEKAVKYWKEALEALRHPEEEEPPPEEQKEPPPEEEKPQPEPEEAPSINEVLRLLQQMDRDDRRPEPQESTPQQGLRPW